jgi:hypothetical protein
VFILGCAILPLLPSKQPGTLGRRIGRFGLFMLLLLIVGAFFNGFWCCLITCRFYYQVDFEFDFSPFRPIPYGHGELFGISLLQLQLIWLLFAAGTWALTIYLYRIIRRRLAVDAASQHTVPSP